MSLRNGVIKAGTVVYKKVRIYKLLNTVKEYNLETTNYVTIPGDPDNMGHYMFSYCFAIVKLITLEDGLIPVKHRRGTKNNNNWDEGHRKCRVPKAYVVSIEPLNTVTGPIKFVSAGGTLLEYKTGEIVVPDSWDENPKRVCTHGIHVFLTRDEAEAYSL